MKILFWTCAGPILLLSTLSIAILKFSSLQELFFCAAVIIGFLFSLKGRWLGIFLAGALLLVAFFFTFPENWVWKLALNSTAVLGLMITVLSFREANSSFDGMQADLLAKEDKIEALSNSLSEIEFALKKQMAHVKEERLKLEEAKNHLVLMQQKLSQNEGASQQLARECDLSSKQLKYQLQEKTELLNQARIDLFQKEGEMITFRKALQEKELELNGSEQELIVDLGRIIRECEELEAEKILLQDIVTDTLKAKKRTPRKSKKS